MTAAHGGHFAFEVVGRDGARSTGVLVAASLEDARSTLSARGDWVVRLQPKGATWLRRHSVAVAELAVFLELLAGLLQAGLPIPRALAVLEAGAPPKTRALALSALHAVNDGRSLSAGLAQHGVLTNEVLALVRAGEASGALGASIAGAGALLATRAARQRALHAALAYPALLLVSGSATLAVLLLFVLPRLSAMLGELGQELPPLTRLVLMGAHAAGWLAPLGALGACTLAAALRWQMRTDEGRAKVHSALARIALLGPLRMTLASARLTTTLGTLLEQGLALRVALPLAGLASGDALVAQRVSSATNAIIRGERPSRALSGARAISRQAEHLLLAGEETGRLGEMALRAGQLDADWVDRRLNGLVRILEPTLILAFAGLVGLFAAAMLQAVYAIRPVA